MSAFLNWLIVIWCRLISKFRNASVTGTTLKLSEYLLTIYYVSGNIWTIFIEIQNKTGQEQFWSQITLDLNYTPAIFLVCDSEHLTSLSFIFLIYKMGLLLEVNVIHNVNECSECSSLCSGEPHDSVLKLLHFFSTLFSSDHI